MLVTVWDIGGCAVRSRVGRPLSLLVAALATLSCWACAVGDGGVTPVSSVTPTSSRPTREPVEGDEGSKVNDDLAKGPATHQLKAQGVRAEVRYARFNAGKIGSGAGTSLRVTVRNARSDKKGKSRLYLSRVVGYTAALYPDGSGTGLDPVEDEADINPGFLISPPATYTQVFNLPDLPNEAAAIGVDFRFEVLVLEPKSSPRDFSKVTLTDEVQLFST